jgi:hypothetical protein
MNAIDRNAAVKRQIRRELAHWQTYMAKGI